MSDKQSIPILPPLNRGAANNGENNGGTAQQTVSLQQVLASAQGFNVLATSSGQQFVITTQVPGLTQVNSFISRTFPEFPEYTPACVRCQLPVPSLFCYEKTEKIICC